MSDQMPLPCGADVNALIEQVVEGRGNDLTSHQRTCPYCQRALAELGRRWNGVLEGGRDVEVQPPPGLISGVMRRVWATVDDQWVEVLRDLGVTEVSTRVLGVVAQDAASHVRGVLDVQRVEVKKADGRATVTVAVQLVVEYGLSISAISEAIRRAVSRAFVHLCATEAAVVDIEVLDVEA